MRCKSWVNPTDDVELGMNRDEDCASSSLLSVEVVASIAK
jgi:hypothetical protein